MNSCDLFILILIDNLFEWLLIKMNDYFILYFSNKLIMTIIIFHSFFLSPFLYNQYNDYYTNFIYKLPKAYKLNGLTFTFWAAQWTVWKMILPLFIALILVIKWMRKSVGQLISFQNKINAKEARKKKFLVKRPVKFLIMHLFASLRKILPIPFDK